MDLTNAFEVRGLTVNYGSIRALANIEASVPRRAIGLLGPNGAGKTTLIRTLLGFLRPATGTGKVLGHDIRTEIDKIRDHVGYSPEFAPMIPEISAQKYVAYMGRLAGLGEIDAEQRAHDALYYVGLGEERYRKLEQFSQGMMQKAKLAAALVHDPSLIILDEPTSGLDPTGRVQMLELIERLYKDEKKSVVVSSHLLFDVEKVCDWMLVISRGKVIASGEKDRLMQESNDVLRVRIEGDVQRFLRQLDQRGLRYQVNNERDIDIVRRDNIEMMVLEIIHSDPQVSIRYLGRKKRTLEDVFVSIIEGEAGTHE